MDTLIPVFRDLLIQSMIQARQGRITVEMLSEFRAPIGFVLDGYQPKNFKVLETSLSEMAAFKESRKKGEAAERMRDTVIADETV